MIERMHIAHFTNTYKPNVNGVVRSVSSFRDAFTRMGHNVFVFAQDSRGYEDVEPFIFRYPAFKIPTVDYSAVLPVSRTINSVFPVLKVDVIHSNHPNFLGDEAASKAEEYNLPLVFTFHTRYDEYSHYIPLSQAFVKGVIDRSLARYLVKAQHIITPSDSIREMLAEYGVTERVTTIPTGIDLRPYQQADGGALRATYGWTQNKVLIFVGRLAQEKNCITLLDAVAQVMSDHGDVRFLILGDGPQRKELQEHAEKLGIADRVVFTGIVPMDEVPTYLKAADLFVFASVTETQGLVTMEAMAAGLPVVAVDATGTGDVVENGKDGLLTANDSTALAQAIRKVLDDQELYARLKAGAIHRAEEFDIMVQARKMLEVYEQAIEDKRANRYIRIVQ